jgi:hypothetical protein
MYESWRHAEWKTGADATVRTDRVGHRRRQLLKLLQLLNVKLKKKLLQLQEKHKELLMKLLLLLNVKLKMQVMYLKKYLNFNKK